MLCTTHNDETPVGDFCLQARSTSLELIPFYTSWTHRFDPLLAFTVLVGILSTFKAYPSLGDTAFYHSLLALYPELVPRKWFTE